MNIYAIKGHRVKVTKDTMNNGSKYDKEQIAKLCELDKEYTVDCTLVSSRSTTVYLKEFPDEIFNSVNFKDVVEQSEEDDRQHAYWSNFNSEDED